MVTVVDVVTTAVVAGKVMELAAAEIVTEAGTVATLGLLLVRLTTAPPASALALSVTVPVELMPPTTAVGLTATEFTASGLTVKVACFVLPL